MLWHWFLHPNAYADVSTAAPISRRRSVRHCLVESWDCEQGVITASHRVSQRPRRRLAFAVSLRGNSLRWVCLSVKGSQREFWKVLTYCSRRDDRQCDYAEGCVSANTKAGTSPLHLLSFAAPVKNVYSRVEPALPPRSPGSLYDMRGFVIVMSSSQRRRCLLMIESCPAQESHGAACWGVWCLQRYIVRLVVTARLK